MTKIYKDCKRFGHDWAFQDCDTYMAKICLRCGLTTFFFPEEVEDDASMDDHRPEINRA